MQLAMGHVNGDVGSLFSIDFGYLIFSVIGSLSTSDKNIISFEQQKYWFFSIFDLVSTLIWVFFFLISCVFFSFTRQSRSFKVIKFHIWERSQKKREKKMSKSICEKKHGHSKLLVISEFKNNFSFFSRLIHLVCLNLIHVSKAYNESQQNKKHVPLSLYMEWKRTNVSSTLACFLYLYAWALLVCCGLSFLLLFVYSKHSSIKKMYIFPNINIKNWCAHANISIISMIKHYHPLLINLMFTEALEREI